MPIRGSLIALTLLPFLAAPVGAEEANPAPAAAPIPAPVIAPAIGEAPALAEQKAVAFRRLQSELMVAALSCRDARHQAHYNIFVTRFRPALRENAATLNAYFRRLHGPMATRRLDEFITGLANQASLASMGDADFCANALARFEAVNFGDGQTAGVTVPPEPEPELETETATGTAAAAGR